MLNTTEDHAEATSQKKLAYHLILPYLGAMHETRKKALVSYFTLKTNAPPSKVAEVTEKLHEALAVGYIECFFANLDNDIRTSEEPDKIQVGEFLHPLARLRQWLNAESWHEKIEEYPEEVANEFRKCVDGMAVSQFKGVAETSYSPKLLDLLIT